MRWRPYQDRQNAAFVSILGFLFPEQTKTLPRLLVWSVIFFIDLVVVIVGAQYLGLLSVKFGGVLTFAVLFGGFWLQGKIFYGIVNLFRRGKGYDD